MFYLDDDHNTVIGSDGNDTVDYSEGNLGIHVDLRLGVVLKTNNQVDYLFGIENVIAPNQNNVLISASDQHNRLVGGDGDDTLIGVGGNDTLVGGGGTNEYRIISDSPDALLSNVTIDNLSSNAKGQLHLDIAAKDLQELIFEGKDLLLRTSTKIETVRLIDWFNAKLNIVTKDGQLKLPIVFDSFFTTSYSDPISGNLLLGATDPDGNTLTITAINGTALERDTSITLDSGAQLNLNADGTFTYNPNGQFEELALGKTTTDSFTHTIGDGQGGTATATVTLVIQGSNDAPVALDKTLTASKNTASYGNLLTGATDPDGDSLTITAINGTTLEGYTPITLPSGALVNRNADETFTYNPNGQFEYLKSGQTANDSFTYTIGDSQGGTATATVALVIQGSNDAPVALDKRFTTSEEDPISGNLLTGAIDPGTATL